MKPPDRPQSISAPRTVAASVAGRDNDGGGILPEELTERTLAGIALCPENDAALDAMAAARWVEDDFTTPAGRVVLAAVNIRRRGRPVDLVTITEALTPDTIKAIGGRQALNRMVDDAPPVSHAPHFISQLREAATKRKLARLAAGWMEQARNGGKSDSILDDIRRAIDAEQLPTGSRLPLIVSAAAFTAAPMPEPAQVIHGVLHAGSKAVYGGPSKAFKSWSLLDMSLAVSTGGDWLGFPTTRGRVLYVNFELQPFALHKRLQAIAAARGCRIGDNLDLWNLRGHGCPMTRLLPDLLRRVEGEGYSLIIPDPIYKTLDGRNENDAGDIGGLCGELEAVAVQTGAAVAFGAHFAKGSASGKESIDRVSGSGVWARDPDAIITATPHEEDAAFTIEMTLRNFPPPLPFVVRWEYPRMMPDTQLDPGKLRKPKSGRPTTYTPADILQHLKDGMTSTQWQKDCRAEGGIPEKSFYRLLDTVRQTGQAVKTGREWSRGAA